jgi:hypothetical protein
LSSVIATIVFMLLSNTTAMSLAVSPGNVGALSRSVPTIRLSALTKSNFEK